MVFKCQRSDEIIRLGALEWDRFALRAKRARNRLQAMQGSSCECRNESQWVSRAYLIEQVAEQAR